MSSKKLPVRSKVITIAVGLFAAVILFFIGFNFLRIQLDFRKYSNLAQDFNTEMGGGYSTEEDINCDVDETACPSIKVTKSGFNFTLEEAQNYRVKIENFYLNKGYQLSDVLDCRLDGESITYCGFNANSVREKIGARVGIDQDSLSMTIMRQ
jgi:hypothetical protein